MLEKISHIGLCVQNIDEALRLLEATVGINSVEYAEMPGRFQKSAYVRIGKNNDLLELMEPMGGAGTVADYLARHGEGIHHISLQVDSAEKAGAAFEAAGCKIIGKGKGIAFVHPKTAFGVLFELVDGTYE